MKLKSITFKEPVALGRQRAFQHVAGEALDLDLSPSGLLVATIKRKEGRVSTALHLGAYPGSLAVLAGEPEPEQLDLGHHGGKKRR